jgi:hypothetical protein
MLRAQFFSIGSCLECHVVLGQSHSLHHLSDIDQAIF